jgi:hypothetical protein
MEVAPFLSSTSEEVLPLALQFFDLGVAQKLNLLGNTHRTL